MKYYLSGIAGAGMNAIAQYLLETGHEVVGSDRCFDKGESLEYKAFLEEKGLTEPELQAWELALVEGGNNAVKHADDAAQELAVGIEVSCGEFDVEARVTDLMPAVLEAVERAGERRGANSKLHVLEGSEVSVPQEWFDRSVAIARAEGDIVEPQASPIAQDRLGEEWEWEESPEITIAVVESVDQAVEWFNRYSPRFVVSLISNEEIAHSDFFSKVDAPFVGNGFTRWVDGQYALDKPELGLSNWQSGRLFGRGGILSGDSAHTIRTRAVQTNPDIGR